MFVPQGLHRRAAELVFATAGPIVLPTPTIDARPRELFITLRSTPTFREAT